MATRRCSICGLDWPMKESYKVCASCEDTTFVVSNCDPMPDDEATKLANGFEFERYYEKHCALNGKLEDRCPLPEPYASL